MADEAQSPYTLARLMQILAVSGAFLLLSACLALWNSKKPEPQPAAPEVLIMGTKSAPPMAGDGHAPLMPGTKSMVLPPQPQQTPPPPK